MKNIKKVVLLITISLFFVLSTNNLLFADNQSTASKLSDDIWKMADRIWVMADRILTMADKILETEKIQSKNLEVTQANVLKTLDVIEKWIDSNNKILQSLIESNNKVSDCMCKK